MYFTPWVGRLLFANILVYFAQQAVPGIVDPLIFYPDGWHVLTHPWTIITYQFLHGGLAHIGFNMLTLWFFGPRVEQRLGGRHFIQMYLFSGIVGALLSFIFSPNAAIIGASGSIFGVMLCFAYFWPRTQILLWGIIPLEARWLVALTTVFAIFSGVIPGAGGGVAHFAHLGGYLGAFLYLQATDPKRVVRKFREKAIAAKPAEALANWKKVDTAKVHEVNRDELNRILDKINQHGLESLTPQERLFLSNFVPPDDRPKVH